MTEPGKFIILEGIDGAGTTTHLSTVADCIRSYGYKVDVSCEPTRLILGGIIKSVLNNRIRAPPESQLYFACLFLADRLDHIDIMRQAMQTGAYAVTDRYSLSSFAYQSLDIKEASGVPLDLLLEMHRPILKPDLTLFLDINTEVALARAGKERTSTELFETREFLKKVEAQYHEVVKQLREEYNIITINSDRPREEVANDITREVRKLISK